MSLLTLALSLTILNPLNTTLPQWNRILSKESIAPIEQSSLPLKDLLQYEQTKYIPMPYADDLYNYHTRDYWANRKELYNRNSGDCEDIAIAQYFDLIEYGIKPSEMLIVILQDKLDKDYHAILLVNYWYVLDINRADVYTIIQLLDSYDIIYGVNHYGYIALRSI